MKAWQHFLIGGTAALLPDAALALFGWRKRWLPESHPLVRIHRELHSPRAIIVVAYASHVIADLYSKHRTGPDE